MAIALKLTEDVLAWLLGALFLYAGALKLVHPDALVTDIQSYDLVSYRVAYLGAYGLPALEVVAAFCLFFRDFRLAATWLLAVLTAVFIIALSTAWVRGIDITCGCFGESETKANYPFLVGRDILIIIGFGFILCRYTRGTGHACLIRTN